MMVHKKIAVLVSGGGTNLQALIDAQERGELGNGKITLVIASKPGVYALERAANHGIASQVLARKQYDSIAEYSKALADALEDADIDLVVLARYMRVLSERVINAYPGRIINIHHAFLPAFQGGNPYLQAWERGVKMIGATAHYATVDLDEGPIIEQAVERITHESTPEDLRDLGRDIERRVLTRAVQFHLEHRVIVSGRRTVVFAK